jgi:hypothetical protein
MTTTPTWRDPIIAELHALRGRLAERFHNDLAAYSQAADAHCRALGFHIVQSPTDKDSGGAEVRILPKPLDQDPRSADRKDV